MICTFPNMFSDWSYIVCFSTRYSIQIASQIIEDFVKTPAWLQLSSTKETYSSINGGDWAIRCTFLEFSFIKYSADCRLDFT